MINPLEEERKAVHKVIRRRTVQQDGLNAFLKKVSQNPHINDYDKWNEIALYPIYKLGNKIYEEENTSLFILKMFSTVPILPLWIASCFAYFPIGMIRRAVANADLENIEKLKILGIYDIIMDRIGYKGYDNHQEMEQNIMSDIENQSKRRL